MFVDSDVSHFQCLSFYGYTVLVFVVLTLVVPTSTFVVLTFVVPKSTFVVLMFCLSVYEHQLAFLLCFEEHTEQSVNISFHIFFLNLCGLSNEAPSYLLFNLYITVYFSLQV